MIGYTELTQLNEDLFYVANNPMDHVFFDMVIRKYHASSDEMQVKIKELLYERLFEIKPTLVIRSIESDNPGTFAIINTLENPFFEV